jgi:hypothetical protein
LFRWCRSRAIFLNHRTTIELNIITETDYLQMKRNFFSLIETFFFLNTNRTTIIFSSFTTTTARWFSRMYIYIFLFCLFNKEEKRIYKKKERKEIREENISRMSEYSGNWIVPIYTLRKREFYQNCLLFTLFYNVRFCQIWSVKHS